MKKAGRKKSRAKVTFSMVVDHDEDVDVVDVIKNRTEFLAEPKSAHGGTVIAMNINSVEPIARSGKSVQEED
jgi:uncharacterized protein (UPF0179 family)